MELMYASYAQHSFSKHFHDGFAIGVIEKGALGFNYRGERHVAYSGTINTANPGEVHNGYPAGENGWTYRMFYLDTEFLQGIAGEIDGKINLPFFPGGVIEDIDLARKIYNLHILLEKNESSILQQEAILLETMTYLISHHAVGNYKPKKIGHEHKSVKQVKNFLEHYYSENISLNELAKLTNLSPFYLLRVFKNQVGIPPHTYLNQIRINESKKLLKNNVPIIEVANQTGFVDQSHLTKLFKRFVGVTPKKYSNIIQDK